MCVLHACVRAFIYKRILYKVCALIGSRSIRLPGIYIYIYICIYIYIYMHTNVCITFQCRWQLQMQCCSSQCISALVHLRHCFCSFQLRLRAFVPTEPLCIRAFVPTEPLRLRAFVPTESHCAFVPLCLQSHCAFVPLCLQSHCASAYVPSCLLVSDRACLLYSYTLGSPCPIPMFLFFIHHQSTVVNVASY